MNETTNPSDWVFGYGSLLWKVDFLYDEKITGYITGFQRRFWQHSTDHRGVPGKPGRVVTLVEKPENKVWGVAYKLHSRKTNDIINHLNHREKGGYITKTVLFHPRNSNLKAFKLNIYIGSPAHEDYAGPLPLHKISTIIAHSVGPSGKNIDYLLNMAKYMRENIPEDQDEHIFELEKLVLKIKNGYSESN